MGKVNLLKNEKSSGVERVAWGKGEKDCEKGVRSLI